jgi:hypothetical protein
VGTCWNIWVRILEFSSRGELRYYIAPSYDVILEIRRKKAEQRVFEIDASLGAISARKSTQYGQNPPSRVIRGVMIEWLFLSHHSSDRELIGSRRCNV